MSIDPFIDEFNRMYDMVMIGRRVELGFGCFVLAYIVVDIVRSIILVYFREIVWT